MDVAETFHHLKLAKRNDPAKITPQQRWMVSSSWLSIEQLISPHGALKISKKYSTSKRTFDLDNEDNKYPLSSLFYVSLIASLSESGLEVKEVFWRFNLHVTVRTIAETMDPRQDMEKALNLLANRHRGRGITNEDYDIVGKHIIDAFSQLPNFPQSTIDAWIKAWEVCVNVMKIPEVVPKPIQNSVLSTIFTMDEVRKHCSKNDAWLVIDDCVYDITQFVEKHPGGDSIIIGLGKDATNSFRKLKHSQNAINLLTHYQIGIVEQNK